MRVLETAVEPPRNLREIGRLRVLQALYDNLRTSRTDLVRRTGLSRATVSALVADLIGTGLVLEDTGPTDQEARPTGRPVQPLTLNPEAAYAVGADIGHQHVRVVLCDLAGTPVWEAAVAKDVDHARHETLDLTGELIRRAISEHGVARERILGLGVGIASPVGKSTSALDTNGVMPGWVGVRPGLELERRTGLPTRVTNDANAGALAERRYGAGRDIDDMVYIRLSAGIGAGVVTDGRLLLGARGLVGEIGHVTAVPDGRICRCGNRGCLETVASPLAIARLLRESWDTAVTAADLPRLVAAGDRGARRAVADAGFAVGRALGTLVTLIDPRRVVVGGDLAVLGDVLLEPLRRGLAQYAMPTATEGVSVVAGELGERAEARGAAAGVLAQAPHVLAAGPA